MLESEIALDVEKAFSRERLENSDSRFAHPPYVLECRLREEIITGKYDAARRTLVEINALERAKLAGDRLRSLKNSLIASCTFFTRAAIAGGLDAELAFTLSDTYIRTLEGRHEISELEDFENLMLRDFITLVNRYQNYREDILTMRAIRIVRARISQPVSLRDTAATLGVSEQYLSSQFTMKQGQSFVAYVQKMKVEESKFFLRTTNLEVIKISQMLGFNYQAYFARVFKKVTGMTPSEYRNKNFVG
jgi:two-component system, response regulator YesN